MSGVTIGRYRIFEKIASGGMASVHFGRLVGEAGFSRTVAIKRLHPHLAEDRTFVATMIDEARLAARIHHPNVVPTLDVVSSDGELLVVMEYVRGEALARLLSKEAQRERLIAPEIASSIAIGVLHGLHAAHEATSDQGEPLGIVHRDVSPQNVLVGVDGVVRVIDFGVAKAAGRLQTTREGAIKGKIPYMAREQLAAQPVTRAADIYAVGVVLWETLTCKRLFQSAIDISLIEQVQAGPKEPPSRYAPHIPPALDAIVMRALARDPGDRFPTALDMAEELHRVVSPAFPTAVGAWCADVARDSLEERARVLADIESQTGASGALAVAAIDDLVRVSGVGRDESRDSGPVLASQPSSVALESPRLSSRPLSKRTGTILGFAGGAIVVAGLGGVAWMLASRPVGPPQTSSPATSEPSVASASPVPSAVSASPVPAASVGVAPTASSNTAPASPPRPVSAVRPADPAKPRPPPRGTSCNPPYVIDAQGHRVYKPACLDEPRSPP